MPEKNSALHAGHRSRMREKFDKFGHAVFTDHELLEMLLYHSIPRIDTNELAHQMINEMGSLYNVIHGDKDRLSQINGVGAATVFHLGLISAFLSRTEKSKAPDAIQYNKLSLVVELLKNHFSTLNGEGFCLICLDGGLHLMRVTDFPVGGANSVSISPEKVARDALLCDASAVIIAHNHPQGNPLPSSSDMNLTHLIEAALTAVGIPLIEHIIVGESSCMPTLQSRPISLRSTLRSNGFDTAFFQHFYSN